MVARCLYRFSIFGVRCISLALIAALSIAVLASAALCAEQPPDLVTDRPTRAANTAIVQPGYALWEAGFKFSRDEEGGNRSDEFDLLDSLFRIGLAEKAELRVGWLSGKWKDSSIADSTSDSTGIGDANLGFKVRLHDEEGRVPAMSLILATTLPVGHDEFSSQRPDPSATMAFSHTLANNVGLVYNLGVVAITDQNLSGDKETDTFFDYSVALSYGGNPLFSPFLEAFGKTRIDDNGSSSFSIGGGMTSLVFPNFQLDASGGIGITDSAADWFVGIGLSVRFPR